MATEKRLKILTEAEIGDLFGPPVLNHNDQRFFFTLNDHELAIAHKIRRRDQRCMYRNIKVFSKSSISEAMQAYKQQWIVQLMPDFNDQCLKANCAGAASTTRNFPGHLIAN